MTIKIKTAAIFLLFTAIFAGSAVQTTGNQASYIVTYLLIFIAYLLLSNNYTVKRYQFAFIAFVGLYFYSIFTSLYIARSAVVAVGMFTSFMFFCVLNDLIQKETEKNNHVIDTPSKAKSSNSYDYLTIAKYALAFVIFLNAITLILSYIDKPVRVTGQFRDYSQSAFSILLAFGLIQPLIKSKIILTPITLIFFLGFFTTFSRTAIFLLAIYLIALFVIEFRNKCLRQYFKVLSLVVCSYALVQIYPLIIETPAVSRGINDITTLNSRTFYWKAAWDAIQRSPILGHGFNTFEFTGIQAIVLFQKVTSVHNDYLQVWHDLGGIWLFFFIITVISATIKLAPITVSLTPKLSIAISETSNQKQIAWVLMVSAFSYMSINFILLSQTFQIIFALLLIELLSDEQT